MDDEKLINLVKHNELIYNKYCKDYKSMEKKKEAWQCIAHEMEASELECIRRWTCLRDRYTKESRRLIALANNGMTTSHLWPLLGDMEFLKQHVVNRSKSVRGTSSYSVRDKEQTEQFSPESFITEQEETTGYEYLTEPFHFKNASSPLSEPGIDQEENEYFVPQSCLQFVKKQNTSICHESQITQLSAANSTNQHTTNRKRQCEPALDDSLSTTLEMFKQVCSVSKTRRQNPAVFGFGQMIVETICEMSTRKQAIAMQKVTELVMNLKMESEKM